MASRVSHRAKRTVPSGRLPSPPPPQDEVLAPDDAPELADAEQGETEEETNREENAASRDLMELADDGASPVATARARALAGSAAVVSRRPAADYLPRWIPSGLRNSLIELSKVTWPARQEAVNLTLLVIALAAVFAVVFGLIDLGLFSALSTFTTKVLGK